MLTLSLNSCVNFKGSKVATIDYKDQAALDTLVSEQYSEWSEPLEVDQDMIDTFAELTGDRLWIHTDPKRCAEQSPFKSTIAHGFLLLSLLPKMPCGDNVTRQISGYRQIMNYGSDKLRFLNPVTVNSQIRARSKVVSVEVGERSTKVTLANEVAVSGEERPALLYHLTLALF